MRKIIWIGGPIPAGWTKQKFMLTAKILSNTVGGELIEFGETNYAIVGDDRAAKKLQFIENQQNIPISA